MLAYDNAKTTRWNDAATACVALGADLCSTAQYAALRYNSPDPFYSDQPVWTHNFSDNDMGVKTVWIRSADNPAVSSLYSYACCSTLTPEPFFSSAEAINGVQVTHVHATEDSTFAAAARMCHAVGSDLCSKSQYVALRDEGVFGATTALWSDDMSDNDGSLFNPVVGPTGDNPTHNQKNAFACCGSARPLNGGCPGEETVNGLCIMAIHEEEDASFLDAARACTDLNADICTNSQMQALRNLGMFSGKGWTASGADNDGTIVGGLLGSQPDNPNPTSTLMGYACCM